MMSGSIKVHGGDMTAGVSADNGAVCVERSDKQRGSGIACCGCRGRPASNVGTLGTLCGPFDVCCGVGVGIDTCKTHTGTRCNPKG